MRYEGTCWLRKGDQKISVSVVPFEGIPNVKDLRLSYRRVPSFYLNNNVECSCWRRNSFFNRFCTCPQHTIADRNNPFCQEVPTPVPLIGRACLSDPHDSWLPLQKCIDKVLELRTVDLHWPVEDVICREDCILFGPTLKKLRPLCLKLSKPAFPFYGNQRLST